VLFYLRNIMAERFGISDPDEAVVTRVEAGTKAVLYFFFSRDGIKPSIVVKAASARGHNDELRIEVSNLRYLQEGLPERIRRGIPSVEVDGEWMGLYYYAQRYIQGDMLEETIDDRPHCGTGDGIATRLRIVWQWLHDFQEATSTMPVRIKESGFESLLDAYRSSFTPDDGEAAHLDEIEKALEANSEAEIAMSACHGDFFPGNIIMDADRVTVIDWRFLRKAYNRFFDFFTLLLTFYASKSGVTDYDDHEGHFRTLFFEKHWSNDMFKEICREFIEQNGVSDAVFDLMIELNLLEWSVREYAASGNAGEMDRIWRKRFLYYMNNRDRFMIRSR